MSKKGGIGLKFEENLLKKGEVSLVIEDYDEIFSDFDPRPFSHRALSVDFLDEARRATRELGESGFELNFLIPASKKSIEKEKVIKGRLKEHFKKHYDLVEKEQSGIVGQGIIFTIFGFIFMMIGAFVLVHYGARVSILKEMLIIVLQPGGWFLLWEGLELLIFGTKVKRSDLEFYKRMTRANIGFSHY